MLPETVRPAGAPDTLKPRVPRFGLVALSVCVQAPPAVALQVLALVSCGAIMGATRSVTAALVLPWALESLTLKLC